MVCSVGIDVDYRLLSLHRKAIAWVYPKPRLDASRIVDGYKGWSRLLDIGRRHWTWDTNTGEKAFLECECVDWLCLHRWRTGTNCWDRWIVSVGVRFQVHQEHTRDHCCSSDNACRKDCWGAITNICITDRWSGWRWTLDFERFNDRLKCWWSSCNYLWWSYPGAYQLQVASSLEWVFIGLSVDDAPSRFDPWLGEDRVRTGHKGQLDRGIKTQRQYDTIQDSACPMVLWLRWPFVGGEGDHLAFFSSGILHLKNMLCSDLRLDDVWSFQQVRSIASTSRTLVCHGNNGLVAVDFNARKLFASISTTYI